MFPQLLFVVECFTTEMANDRCVFGLLTVVDENIEVLGLVVVPKSLCVLVLSSALLRFGGIPAAKSVLVG